MKHNIACEICQPVASPDSVKEQTTSCLLSQALLGTFLLWAFCFVCGGLCFGETAMSLTFPGKLCYEAECTSFL